MMQFCVPGAERLPEPDHSWASRQFRAPRAGRLVSL